MIKIVRETHEPPPEISRILRVAGGLNRFGEANYRVVWGQSRLDFVGGKWEDRDDEGKLIREAYEVRRVPKYAVDRWILERWMPPETYGAPVLWEMQTFETVDGHIIPALGPFPSRGDYEGVFVLQDLRGNFLQLTPMIARAFVAALERSREERPISRTERISREKDRQDREYDAYADSVMHDGSTITGPMVSVP